MNVLIVVCTYSSIPVKNRLTGQIYSNKASPVYIPTRTHRNQEKEDSLEVHTIPQIDIVATDDFVGQC
jgi:hypothetical protein